MKKSLVIWLIAVLSLIISAGMIFTDGYTFLKDHLSDPVITVVAAIFCGLAVFAMGFTFLYKMTLILWGRHLH